MQISQRWNYKLIIKSFSCRLLFLTWISEVELVLEVREVLFLFQLYPVSICLLVVADEDPKQHNHSNLPDEADGRQADADVGVLLRPKEVGCALTAVPHLGLLFFSATMLDHSWGSFPAEHQHLYIQAAALGCDEVHQSEGRRALIIPVER